MGRSLQRARGRGAVTGARATAATAAGLLLACAGGGELAGDMATAFGEGALEGFADYVTYESGDQWGKSWEPSGRGVTGVVSRSATRPDCSGIDDESMLYVGDLLNSPGSFVSTVDGSIDEREYASFARTDLRLGPDLDKGLIGILETTAGRHARFVLTWGERPVLHGIAVYDTTGDAVLRFERPMPLAPHALVNLDPGEPEGFDLLYGPDPDGRPTLAAGEGAALSFPIESLCGP